MMMCDGEREYQPWAEEDDECLLHRWNTNQAQLRELIQGRDTSNLAAGGQEGFRGGLMVEDTVAERSQVRTHHLP